MRRPASAAALLVATVAVTSSCGDIEARRRSTAPLNASATYPCDRYEGTPVRAQPRGGRCEVPVKPTFDFTILVNVPETSAYAAGHTFVMRSSDLDKPPTPTNPRCAPPCLTLPLLVDVIGAYQVTSKFANDVGYEMADNTSIPVRATYLPQGFTDGTSYDPTLPLDVLFASSRIEEVDGRDTVAYERSLPVGGWTRVFDPQPPYDAYFPPRIDGVPLERGGRAFDLVDLGGASGALDDPTGTSRDAVVRRAEGLEGWKAWLEDHQTGRRISIVSALSGTRSTPRLVTSGWGTSLEGVDAIVAPPDGFLAVPTLVNPLAGGQGLQTLDYPSLRPPVGLEGLVADKTATGALLSVASKVTFTSASIILPDGTEQTLLKYSTTVSTDDRGRFATVLPPGTYDITVEPVEGTGYATHLTTRVIDDSQPLTLTPPKRTKVHGVAMLSDGRPLASAEILAQAEPKDGATATKPAPRPGRARTDETGAFSMELDQGSYVLTVVPEDGTGFPRVVVRRTIPLDETDLGTLSVPPPSRLELTFREPSSLANPIPDARVRIFAKPINQANSDATQAPLLEIGFGMTDAAGKVEILLAQQPK